MIQKKVAPLWKSFHTGNFSPAETYEKVRSENSFLLESVYVGHNPPADSSAEMASPAPRFAGMVSPINRYSFIGIDPYLIFKSKKNKMTIIKDSKIFSEKGDPIRKLKSLMKQYNPVKEDCLPPFSGGAAGYISYDARHLFERLPANAPDDMNIPDIYFVFTDKVIAFDHFDGKVFIICNTRAGGYNISQAKEEIEHMEETVFSKKKTLLNSEVSLGSRITSNFTRDEFMSVVQKAKEHIKCGDIYQANLSQRLSVSIEGDSWNLYKILREVNPSPFASFLDFEDVRIVSSSPERLLFVKGAGVETRPIAGTRPRGKSNSEDKKLSRDLILSPKERAEHIMLVDLERNDLGRVSEYGTVEVNELMTLENYSHVIHIVSNVRGRLRRGMDGFSAIRACFPGGTITGTPKIRSMEIIDELEKVARGIYTGSIGYLDYGGGMDLNIVIRTFVIKDGHAYIQVGAGIVADSDPEREYYETLHKAEALLTSVKRINKVPFSDKDRRRVNRAETKIPVS